MGTVSQLRRPRAAEIAARVTAQGLKLPLDVMIDSMHRLLAEAERLEASDTTEAQVLGRVARDKLFRVAVECAPFFHPKISNTVISGDPDNPLLIQRHDPYAALSTEQVQGLIDDVNSGRKTIAEVNNELGR